MAAALGLTFLVTGTGSAAPQVSTTPPGIGNALAETVKVDPRAGGLSIGITLGRAIAGHQNSVAQASSQAIDLGVIGTTMAAQGCDGSPPSLEASKQPQALQVDSRQQGVSDFKSEGESKVPGGDVLFLKKARATTAPFGEAITTTAPFGVANVLEVGGGVAHTTSGLVGDQRVATATVDISSIKLAGQIALEGLHWEVSYPSTGDAQPSGTFTIGRLTVAGQTVPTQDAASALAGLNALLGTVGLQLQPPTFVRNPTFAYVAPLGISVVPNAARDQVFASVLRGVQPIRQPLFDALLKAKCTLSSEITVFDIALGSISGSGSFNLLLGGVQASSGEAPVNNYVLGGFGKFPGLAAPPAPTAPPIATAAAPRPTGTPTPTPTPTTQAAAPRTQSNPIQQVSVLKRAGERGGPLAVVGFTGLVLLATAAEADRRKMRAALRVIAFDE